MKKKLLVLVSLLFVAIFLIACGDKKYTVSFDLNGGDGTIEAKTVKEGAFLEIPDKPTKTGFDFDYWQEKDSEEKWDFGRNKVNKNMTLIAQWKVPDPVTYTVKFLTIDNAPKAQTVNENDLAVRPADPTRAEYKFLDWYLDDEAFDFNTPITADIQLVAKWEKLEYVDIAFDLQGGLPAISTKQILKGLKVDAPTKPTKNNHKFLGWYLGDNEFDFETEINEDITLIAKWELTHYEVTFEFDDAISIPVVENVLIGENIVEITTPERSGYNFLGWSLEGEEELFDFLNTIIDSNITLVANWEKVYTVTFYLDAALTDVYNTQTVRYGGFLTLVDDPSIDNYAFKGWFIDDVEFNFDNPVNEDLVVIAKLLKELTVIYYEDDEATEPFNQFSVLEGELVPQVTVNPEKDFHTFLGWYLGEDLYVFETPVMTNLVLIGKWEEEEYQDRAFIESIGYRSIGLAVEAANSGDTILISPGDHTLPFHIDKDDLTFMPLYSSERAWIYHPITIASGVSGVTFKHLFFTDAAYIKAAGEIDNFNFIENNVVNLTMIPSSYMPNNRIDVNAFISLYTLAGENIVGNVNIIGNNFDNIQADIISIARTSIGKEIVITDNYFYNTYSTAIRFDGGYNNGHYKILSNIFENEEGRENLSSILFRAYSSSSGNTQTIDIKFNTFINVGSTKEPMVEDYPGSGVIKFSTFNEQNTVIDISSNTFTNTANSIHLRNKRDKLGVLNVLIGSNEFIDSIGYIFYESDYKEGLTEVMLDGNVYKIDGETVSEAEVASMINRVIRE